MITDPEVPSILVGLGSFGARVVDRVIRERAEALGGAPDDAALTSMTFERGARADAIGERVLADAKALLAHGRMVRARDRRSAEGLTRLHVFVVAHLGESEPRALLAPALAAIEARLLGELSPIFESFRTGAERNLVVLPLCAMPHPGGFERGDDVIAAVKALGERIAATPPRRRAVPQLFLIEDVAEYSVLGDAELTQCVRNFLCLLLYSLSAVSRVAPLLYGNAPASPLATFVCAVSELPRRALTRYATDAVALEVVDAVIAQTEGGGADFVDIDAIEEVELAAFDAPRDADRDVLELLGRYAPAIARDVEPPWWERSETTRARYGPDPGDPSVDDGQPAPDPPVGWALARMREIEKTWTLLQRRRFDDLISGERERVVADRDAVVASIARRVDDALFSDPSPVAFRRAGALVERMERAVSLRLEDAIRDRDAALPVPPPSFEAFRDAHAAMMDAARRKPDLGRMILWGGLFVTLVTLFLPLGLRALADAIGVGEADWQSPWLRERGWLTALLFASAGAGTYLFLRYRRAHLALTAAFHAMFDALENTVTGLRDSVLEYFASRLRLAREVARVEALLAVRSAILGDRERLTLIDRAARRARGELLESLRTVRVERTRDGRLDASGLFGAGDEALIESLLPPESARFLDALLPIEERDGRVRDVLFALAREQRYRERWREEAPFTSIGALREAAWTHAEPAALWDPLAMPESAEATAQALAAFARRQARSLKVALNVSGHDLGADAATVLEGELIAPPRAYDATRRFLAEEGAGGRVRIPVHRGLDPDRAFYVVAIGDIAEGAVASLTAREPRSPPRSA
ncbi:MAG: hypothetical protein KF729_12995 [Sandaracinaceae bacterium]|nr:hypothetical protein [Sandaracinaceae bacterium]